MPSVTPKQHRAMAAAAFGHSTLGIPKSVGQEFVQADEAKANRGNRHKGRHRKRPKYRYPGAKG